MDSSRKGHLVNSGGLAGGPKEPPLRGRSSLTFCLACAQCDSKVEMLVGL